MKVDTTVVLKDIGGNPIKDGDKSLTLGNLISQLLSNQKDAIDPLKAYLLAKKFYEDKEVEIDASDKKNIEEVAKKAYTPLLAGQVIEILDSLK